MRKNDNNEWPMKVFIITTTFVVAYLAYSYAHKVYRDYEIQKQIDVSKSEIVELQKDNEQMTDYINYLRSDVFKEKKAKQILNLKNEGEIVVVFEEGDEIITTYSDPTKRQYLSSLPNKDKWWEYFFGDLALREAYQGNAL